MEPAQKYVGNYSGQCRPGWWYSHSLLVLSSSHSVISGHCGAMLLSLQITGLVKLRVTIKCNAMQFESKLLATLVQCPIFL